MPAPTVHGYTTHSAASGAVATLQRPAGVQNGDWLVMAYRNQALTNTSGLTEISLPAGWSKVSPALVSNANYRFQGVYAKKITNVASEPSSYDFSVYSGGRRVAIMFIVRGAKNIGGHSVNYWNGLTEPGFSATPNGTQPGLVLYCVSSEHTAGQDHAPGSGPGVLVASATNPDTTATTASRTNVHVRALEVNSGSIAAATAAYATASTSSNMTAVYVQGGDPEPEPEPEPSGAGLPVQLTARSGLAFHKTSTGIKTPQLVKYLPRGYRDIDHMLSGEFWWAHRGGSASFPEHALWSYTQSALIGYGALEISLNRTSDGVWFGLHDSTLDRTSGVSGIDPTTLTWAQVQQYQIIIGASGAPKPYMRLEELAAVYGSTHIIIVDPKYRHSTHRAEFFTKIGQLLDKSRTIVKFSYDNVSFRDMAKAQGWKTWGYGYAENLVNDPNWSTRMSGWDILGMEYSASQTVWNQVKALGRPVVAHICPTQASVDTGRAKGANGFQCSGVAGIIPLR